MPVREDVQHIAADVEQRVGQVRPRPISTRTHAILDYTLGPTLALAPNVFGFPTTGAATAAPRAYGAASMVYSALTRYELGIEPALTMKGHLIIDAVGAGMLAASPWVFRFGRRRKLSTWLPHAVFAAVAMGIVLFSDARSNR